MARLREKRRLRGLRILGITLGIPEVPYIPSVPGELRGFKLKFYDLSDIKIGEIGSDIKTGLISRINFELMGLGCAAFSFVCDDEPAFTVAYRTRVDIHPYFTEAPWFTGFIQTLPQPGKKRPFEYTGFGFFEQLDWVLVTGSYEDDDIAVIVSDIIQNTVAPNTQIIYNAAKIISPSYTVESIDFDHVSAKDAIQTLANMAQGFEFGIDDSREFYFRAIDSDTHHSLWSGKHFQEADIEENPFTVRNKLYIKIGEIQAGGSNIVGSVQDDPSIAAYGLREEVIDIPESLDSTDATRWANEILAQKKDPEMKAKIKNVILDDTKAKIEARGKIRITTYEGSEYELSIKKIGYSITSGGITADLELE